MCIHYSLISIWLSSSTGHHNFSSSQYQRCPEQVRCLKRKLGKRAQFQHCFTCLVVQKLPLPSKLMQPDESSKLVTNESTNRVWNPRLYLEVCTMLNTSSRVFAQRSANSYWQLRQGKGGATATDNLRQHEVEPWPSTASPRPYSGKSHKKNLLGPLETLQTLLFQAGAFSKSAPKGKQLHVKR